MGTFVSIEAAAASPAVALAAIDAAFAAIAAVEARMHPGRPGSDLARIDAASPGTEVAIDTSAWEVLSLARHLHALTAGVFDPCLPVRAGSLRDLVLGPHAPAATPPRSPWVLCRVPLSLDFGGIAKGYAIDRAIAALKAKGCTGGLVNAGGDLRVFGARCHAILLRRPDGGYERLLLRDAAVAVSDVEAARRPPGHRGYYDRVHGLLPARRYAAVQAPDAMRADALTKCVLLCQDETAQRALRELAGRSLP